MIVRDETAVLERCLASVRGLVDSWVICDTGSTDETPALARRLLGDLPGELHERPWQDFGHNRSELMSLASGRADYLLLLDADMTIRFDRAGLENLTADAYLVRHDGPVEYWVRRFVKGDREWRFLGSTHEQLVSDGPEVVARLGAIVVEHHADGGNRSEKFDRDIALLQQDLRRDPENRCATFYLAQTYRDVGRTSEAIQLYERRAAMGGWDEEVFYSMFQAGAVKAANGDWAGAQTALTEAWERRPSRLEPAYELASQHRLRGEHRAAYEIARRAIDRPQPDDVLFVWPWAYRWGLLFEYSISAYWVGNIREAQGACQRLLTLTDLPAEYRAATVKNLGYCVRALLSG